MARRQAKPPEPDPAVVEDALSSLSAEDLREVIRATLPRLDDRNRDSLVTALIDKAARSSSSWVPDAPSSDSVAAIVTFAEAAIRVGTADPSDFDEYLRQGTNAFLAKDYPGAVSIFRALLLPISDGEVYLGEDEVVDEVLNVDAAACASQYVVATYMTAAPSKRAESVRAAIEEVSGVGHFWEPLREMEDAAIEPLPEFDDFLEQWRGGVEKSSGGNADIDEWRREVVQRTEGVDGLAVLARSTRCADDLRAWCHLLVESKDWKAALSAHKEAAEIVTDKEWSCGEFLDGVALATQELGRRDLPACLERAWRGEPNMLRLRRWLGSSSSKATVRKRARRALEACPKDMTRQRAFLHVVTGDFASAAKRLAAAPGLGWSDGDHPGHLLFPVFQSLLGGRALGLSNEADVMSIRGMDIGELEWMTSDREGPELAAPELDEILKLAGVDGSPKADVRTAMLQAMRKAAEKRVAGVTEEKRRRYYGHAAALVAACAAVDPAPATAKWVDRLREEYRRYPALQSEFDRHLERR